MSDPNDDVVFKLRNWKLRTDLRVAIDQAADEIERLREQIEARDAVIEQRNVMWSREYREKEALRAALERARRTMETVQVFVTSRERIMQSTGEEWYREEIRALDRVLLGPAETGSVVRCDACGFTDEPHTAGAICGKTYGEDDAPCTGRMRT